MACFIFLLKLDLLRSMTKFESHKLDLLNSRYEFCKTALKSVKNRNRRREGPWLTEGSHVSVTQRAEASSVAGDLYDGEASGGEGTNMFLTSRQTY